MRYPNPGILLYICMADAYAMATEYIKFPRDRDTLDEALRFDHYVPHPTHDGHRAGKFSDDGDTAIGNAFVMLECDEPYTTLNFANAKVDTFNRNGRRRGYSRNYQLFLERMRDGNQFLREIRPDSEKNGGQMGVAPFGVLPTVPRVLDAATTQCALTHNTPPALFGARVTALMAHYAMYESGPLSDVREYCLDHLERAYVRDFGHIIREPWDGRPVVGEREKGLPVSLTTAQAVITLVAEGRSLMEILRRLIEWGGDTDSVAACAWGVASARFQDEILPDFMERDLECGNPHTGAPFLRDLGTRLMAKFA